MRSSEDAPTFERITRPAHNQRIRLHERRPDKAARPASARRRHDERTLARTAKSSQLKAQEVSA